MALAGIGASALGRCAGTAVVALAVAVRPTRRCGPPPGEETRAMWRSVNLGATGHAQFFRGEITDTPGPTFYAVALPLRMTPWVLAALALAVVVLVARRDLRPVGGALACMLLPPAVGVSLASKQFDRYGLPLLAPAAVAVGVALAGLWDRLGAEQLARVGSRRRASGPPGGVLCGRAADITRSGP